MQTRVLSAILMSCQSSFTYLAQLSAAEELVCCMHAHLSRGINGSKKLLRSCGWDDYGQVSVLKLGNASEAACLTHTRQQQCWHTRHRYMQTLLTQDVMHHEDSNCMYVCMSL